MPNLVLIKHSRPDVRPGLPPSQWPLSEEGLRAIPRLVERLRPLNLDLVLASKEPKAAETGRLSAQALALPFEVREGLHEHAREQEPFEPDRAALEAKVRLLFDRPSQRVFGDESADEALARFETAVDAILRDHEGRNLAIVAHGTVISLYVASKCAVGAFDLWQRLGTPSFAVIRLPELELVDVA